MAHTYLSLVSGKLKMLLSFIVVMLHVSSNHFTNVISIWTQYQSNDSFNS